MKRNVPTVLTLLIASLLAPAAPSHAAPGIIEHSGMCDASAAVPAGPAMFVVANDEDNVLRVYRRNEPGGPVSTFDLSPFLKPDAEHPEADLEGAARVGDRVYWITSHGANKNGKPRPSRRRFFAAEIRVAGDEVTLTPVGTPYQDLVADLTAAPALRDFKLGEAALRAPEEAGGLNIEGLGATPQGTLLIAFRNPIPDGKALLVALENPGEVVEGKTAKLGAPILLPLGGRGIRSIEYSEARGKYLIVAGPSADDGDFKLYQWSGPHSDDPGPPAEVDFAGLGPEALIVDPGERTRIQLLSDDGAKPVEGKQCKDAQPARQSFRSIRVNS